MPPTALPPATAAPGPHLGTAEGHDPWHHPKQYPGTGGDCPARGRHRPRSPLGEQEVPRRRRARRRDLRPARGRDPRAGGRERRRQVHPDQGAHRRVPARRGRTAATGRAGLVRPPARGPAGRHLHHLPGGQPRPADERGPQHLPGPRAEEPPRAASTSPGCTARRPTLLERLRRRRRLPPALAHLGVGTQQMVALARAVSVDARVVIMDEPTSSLEPREVETAASGSSRSLRGPGHRRPVRQPPHGRAVPDLRPVTVLRDGRLRPHRPTSPTSTACSWSR